MYLNSKMAALRAKLRVGSVTAWLPTFQHRLTAKLYVAQRRHALDGALSQTPSQRQMSKATCAMAASQCYGWMRGSFYSRVRSWRTRAELTSGENLLSCWPKREIGPTGRSAEAAPRTGLRPPATCLAYHGANGGQELAVFWIIALSRR